MARGPFHPKIYTDYLEVGDGNGETRRVLLEGTEIDYNSLVNKPVVVLPGYLPPIALTADTQELSGLPTGNGTYAYTSSVSPASVSLFRLSGFMQEVRFNNVWNIVTTLTLPILASIAKYAIRAGGAATFPSDFSVLFFDVNNL